MLTYATLTDYARVREIGAAGQAAHETAIFQYLLKATDYIDRQTLRAFFPYQEIKQFTVPMSYFDLANRALTMHDLDCEADLLEVLALTTGTGASETTLTTDDYYLLDFNLYPKYGIRLVWPNTWSGQYASQALRSRYPQIFVDALWGFHDRYARAGFIDTQQVIPAAGLALGGEDTVLTSITGNAVDGLPAFEIGLLYRMGNELLTIKELAISTGTVSWYRAQQGSEAAAYAAGVKIYRYSVPHSIRGICVSAAKAFSDADRTKGGRAGVSEVSTGVAINLPEADRQLLRKLRRPLT